MLHYFVCEYVCVHASVCVCVCRYECMCECVYACVGGVGGLVRENVCACVKLQCSLCVRVDVELGT